MAGNIKDMRDDHIINPIKPQRSEAGFPQRDRYRTGQSPTIRIALEEEVSTKIAILRYIKAEEGESLHSLSSVIEDAILHYFDFYMTDRDVPDREQYSRFLKTRPANTGDQKPKRGQ